MHSAWSIGSFIAPLIVSLFLGKQCIFKEDAYTTVTCSGNRSNNSPQVISSNDEDSLTGALSGDTGLVQFGFLTMGILIALTSTGFILVYILTKNAPNHTLIVEMPETSSPKLSKMSIQVVLVGLTIFFLLFQWVEDIPADYFATFVTGELKWTVESGSFITSVFWLTQGIGCIIGIPLSTYMSPRTMVLVNLLLGCVSWLILLVENTSPVLVWVSAALAGFGVSTATASATLWCSSYVRISGVVAGLLTAGTAIGSMTGSALAGVLMENFTHFAMVYLCLTTNICVMVIFTILLIYVRYTM